MNFITEKEKKFLSNILINLLNELLKNQIVVDFQDNITNENFKEFNSLEVISFSKEIRYTKKELIERFSNNAPLFFFIRDEKKTLATILGYEYENDSSLFFLDTLIVTEQKKGIGKILLESLTKLIKFRNLRGIILFTEEFNFKGDNLINFYFKNGFQKINQEEGNITMIKLIH